MRGASAERTDILRGGLRASPSPRRAREPTLELRERFSALFAHLEREEETLKNLTSQNDYTERQLQDLRPSSQLPRGFLLDQQASELRQQALLAEQRCALQSGEAGAMALAAAAYERQFARLQERCQAEASQEHAATESLGRSASELHDLTAECRELSGQLESVEAQRQGVLQEQQRLQEQARQTALKSKEVQELLGEQRFKAQKLQEEVAQGQADLAALEKLLAAKQNDLQKSKRCLTEEKEAALQSESRLREKVGKKTRSEEELGALQAQLQQCRKEGFELQTAFDETCREAKQLQARLQAEELRHSSAVEAAEAAKAQKERLEAELTGAEGAKADAEKELGDLRKLAGDLSEHCSSQRQWREEQLQKQAANELAAERLRKEIQQLHAEQDKLQEEAKLTMHKRNRLEIELQVAKPALDDARRRCKDLEGRLVSRVRELGDESERVRRLQHEMAKVRLVAEGSLSSARKLDDFTSPRALEGRQKCLSPQAPSPALAEPLGDLGGRLGKVEVATYSPSSPPVVQGIPHPTLKEPRGDMSGGRFSKLNSPGTLGSLGSPSAAAPLPAQLVPSSMDTVRFLCDYVTKEEARLGLQTPKSG